MRALPRAELQGSAQMKGLLPAAVSWVTLAQLARRGPEGMIRSLVMTFPPEILWGLPHHLAIQVPPESGASDLVCPMFACEELLAVGLKRGSLDLLPNRVPESEGLPVNW